MREHKFKGYKFYSHTTETGLFTLNQHRDYDEDYWDKIVQYTGINDVNGSEIYEGDIVYLAGINPSYEVEWPFIELIEGSWENDIGRIVGNIYETKDA